MSEGLNVTCDTCKEKFSSRDIKVLSEHLIGGITDSYFNCPHCNARYSIMKTDSRIERLIERQRKLEDIVRGSKRGMTSEELNEWESRQSKIKELINEMNGKR